MNTKSCFAPAHILLPSEQIPLEKWGCIACDQFTSDRDYWKKAEAAAAGSPSTLNMILPEVYLEDGDADARIEKIHATMDDYARNVLTRAVDRVVGTVLGVAIGALVVVVVNHHVIPELILGVLCIFLASYFGSLQYTYLVVFITVMIAALFDLLGVFDLRLLLIRIDETVAGSLIGVVCAYFILSINSRPMLVDSIAKYFDALDDALACVATGLTAAGERHQITEATQRLEHAKVNVESACSSTQAVALLEPRSSAAAVRQPILAIHHCTHSLTIAAIVVSGSEPPQVFTGPDATEIRAALDRIRQRANVTRAVLSGEVQSAVEPAHIPVISLFAKLNVEPDTPRGEAIVAASRLNQVLEDLGQAATQAPDAAEQQ